MCSNQLMVPTNDSICMNKRKRVKLNAFTAHGPRIHAVLTQIGLENFIAGIRLEIE